MAKSPFSIAIWALVFVTLGLEVFNLVNADENGKFITLYTASNFQGVSREIYLVPDQCFPLFGTWRTEVASIKLNEACIFVYDLENCKGSRKILDGLYLADRNSAANLEKINYRNQVHSIELC